LSEFSPIRSGNQRSSAATNLIIFGERLLIVSGEFLGGGGAVVVEHVRREGHEGEGHVVGRVGDHGGGRVVQRRGRRGLERRGKMMGHGFS